MRKIERIKVPAEDRERLRALARGRNTPRKIVWRARIVCWRAREWARPAVRKAGVSVLTVRRWRRRHRDSAVFKSAADLEAAIERYLENPPKWFL